MITHLKCSGNIALTQPFDLLLFNMPQIKQGVASTQNLKHVLKQRNSKIVECNEKLTYL